MKKSKLNASEAVYGFVSWLTTREKLTLMGSSEDSGYPCQLVKRYCKYQNLPCVTDNWPENLIPMNGEGSDE